MGIGILLPAPLLLVQLSFQSGFRTFAFTFLGGFGFLKTSQLLLERTRTLSAELRSIQIAFQCCFAGFAIAFLILLELLGVAQLLLEILRGLFGGLQFALCVLQLFVEVVELAQVWRRSWKGTAASRVGQDAIVCSVVRFLPACSLGSLWCDTFISALTLQSSLEGNELALLWNSFGSSGSRCAHQIRHG